MIRWPFRRREPAAPAPPSPADIVREVHRIELVARRLMDGPALGPYESVFRGHGIEFSEVRRYQPGDPFQAIDWKVTARMRRPYVKRFVEERELAVLLAVDLSASTRFGTRGRQKAGLAAELAGVLALAAIRAQGRVGLLLFTDRVERYVRPRRGRNRGLRLVHELVAYEPRGRGTDLPEALTTAARLLTVRSLVFVLSDFLPGPGAPDTREPLTRSLLALSRRHDVVGLHLVDPAETAVPEAGLLEVEDPETGRRRVLDLASPSERQAVMERAARDDAALEEVFRRCRVDRVRIRTDEPYVAELGSFFAARARRRRRP